MHLKWLMFKHPQKDPVQVNPSGVESELGLLQVKVKRMSRHAVELRQPPFGVVPEALNAIHVAAVAGELAAVVVHPHAPGVADVDQAIVPSPAVGMNDAVEAHPAPDRPQQRGFSAVRHDLGVNPSVAFEQSEDDRFAAGTASLFASDATRAEVTFIDLDFTGERRRLLTITS